MNAGHPPHSQNEAASAFNSRLGRTDGDRIVASLTAGLDTLSTLMLDRVSTDPEFKCGVDSMLMPVSLKGHVNACHEIELYQGVESAETVRLGRYVPTDDRWYLTWLVGLRFSQWTEEASAERRLAVYRAQPPDARRLSFETALERALPQANHAPLVLYRLFPLAVEAITAVAFGDLATGEAARKRQLELLPNLADCHDCRGRLLDNGEECRHCGNPLWRFDWLTAE
jgi:hypothetical protein